MKISKFIQISKKLHRLEVIQLPEEGLQFLNNGYVVFLVHNLPPLNDEMIYALLDLSTESEREKIQIAYSNDTGLNYCDDDPAEEPIKMSNVTIDDVMPVFTVSGLYYFNPVHLKCFDGEDYQLVVRYREGNDKLLPYIAVKRGMIVLGFVMLSDFNKDFHNAQKQSIMELCGMLEADCEKSIV